MHELLPPNALFTPWFGSLNSSRGDYNSPSIAFTESPSGLDCRLPLCIVESLNVSGVKIRRRPRDMYPQSILGIEDISVKTSLFQFYVTVDFLS